jgi:aspartokinase
MRGVSVFKLGGSSFPTLDSYREIARRLLQFSYEQGPVCVVVSAMSGTTGSLAELLSGVAPDALAPHVDAVLSTGEVLAAALMNAALVAEGGSSESLNAYQLGWLASGDFTNADLLATPASALQGVFENSSFAVVAGGQALTQCGRIAMLGRNSSDLTAVVCASVLGAKYCTIVSDVEGVHTADPYRINGTRIIPALSYSDAEEYSRLGAKVLHHKCVSAAQLGQIEIRCASVKQDWTSEYGTVIGSSGFGIQACFADSLSVYSAASHDAAANAVNEVRAKGGLAYLLDGPEPTFAIAKTQANQLSKLPAYSKLSQETLLVARCVTGEKTLLSIVERQVGQAFAQSWHDEMIGKFDFPVPQSSSEKQRGSHSRVFNTV